MTEPLLNTFAFVSARVAELLVSSVWMGLALVAGVALLLKLVPRLSAAGRSRIWQAVLVVAVLLPVISLGRRDVSGGMQGRVHASGALSYVLAAIWATFSLVRLLQLCASGLQLRKVRRRAVPISAEGELAALLARSERRVGLAVSADVSKPSVAGFLRPQILLPDGLMEELSPAELKHVVLHEMEHLRRWDDWTNLLQKLALALFTVHPGMLWLDRKLCVERELACDDGVLRVTQARKAYAACLARLAEDSMMRRGLSLALGLLGVGPRRSELSRRVQRILMSPAAALGRTQSGAVTALVLAGIVGGTVVLTQSPQLVSFGGTPAALEQASSPAPPVATASGSAMPFRAVAARAVMPPVSATGDAVEVVKRPHVVRTFTLSRKPKAELGRVALNEQPELIPASQPMVVFTAWEQPMAMPHLTLAVAHESDDFDDARSVRESQAAYAAVPVRGGWLLIQL